MFTIEVPVNKMKEFDNLMNEANVTYRTGDKTANGSIIIVSVKRQSQLDKAKEIAKNLV